ncbi:MAG: glycolate oxidase subunit GlcE [Dechloromonas sp.]|nr:glycolate oxidase subunit GlcE [Dechloromonas sp.]
MQRDDLVGAVQAAYEARTPLRLRGAGSKDFYGGVLAGEVLDLAAYCGVVAYEPTELYVTARCGTPLRELEAVLAERGQMLACEPPRFAGATVGGAVAAGLSGPRRQQAGAVRDFVLGVQLIDGTGQWLNFGGQVMKNVAGYDVSRFMAGSLGTLGVIAEVTLKVLPLAVAETTLVFACDASAAIQRLNQWGRQALPISASFWQAGQLHVRLSGAAAAVLAARRQLGGEVAVDGENWWISVREQTQPAFAGTPLWRLALPSTAPDLPLAGLQAMEWGGGLRWYGPDAGEAVAIRAAATAAGGHAVLYRAAESQRCRDGVFAPLNPALLALHRRLKKVFDPRGILNPGRLYAEF